MAVGRDNGAVLKMPEIEKLSGADELRQYEAGIPKSTSLLIHPFLFDSTLCTEFCKLVEHRMSGLFIRLHHTIRGLIARASHHLPSDFIDQDSGFLDRNLVTTLP